MLLSCLSLSTLMEANLLLASSQLDGEEQGSKEGEKKRQGET